MSERAALLEEGIVHIFKLGRWIRKVKHAPKVLEGSATDVSPITAVAVTS